MKKGSLFLDPAPIFAITPEKNNKKFEDICYTEVDLNQAYI